MTDQPSEPSSGPWKVHQDTSGWCQIRDGCGCLIARGLTKADAEQIVRCVNAVDILDLPKLEHIDQVIERYERRQAAWAKLVELAEAVDALGEGPENTIGYVEMLAFQALELAKGNDDDE